MERVFTTFNQLERRIIFANRIQVHATFNRAMATADIDDKAVVDKHPHIIIATEFKVLPLHIPELRRNLHSKAVIVLTALDIPVKLRIQNRLG